MLDNIILLIDFVGFTVWMWEKPGPIPCLLFLGGFLAMGFCRILG